MSVNKALATNQNELALVFSLQPQQDYYKRQGWQVVSRGQYLPSNSRRESERPMRARDLKFQVLR